MLIRITQNDIDNGRLFQWSPNMFCSRSNPISWAIARMWNGEPTVDLIIDRVFVDHSFWHRIPMTPRACVIEMPEEVRQWFKRFMESNDIKPIQFVVSPSA